VYLAERRSLRRLAVPTLDHEVVDLARTVGWLAENNPVQGGVVAVLVVAAGAVGNDLVVCQLIERTLSGERQDLPQCHGERPHVSLR